MVEFVRVTGFITPRTEILLASIINKLAVF